MFGFTWPDYCVFLLMLAISAFIGIYYAYKDRKSNSTDKFLLGDRKLSIFPVALSIMASFTSAISILGFSQEMYKYGTLYWFIGFSYFFTQPFAAEVYVPLFHRLKLTTAYEYLELRFSYSVRITASIIFCIQMILYQSVVLYTPSVAIQQVTGLSLWVSIILTGIICTIYTTIGGIKAVVWTDAFQAIVMFLGLIGIIIKGIYKVGSFSEVWRINQESGRIEFFDFSPNPFQRHTTWALTIGSFFTSLTVYGSNQATIQRYLAMRSVQDAKKAMYINLIGVYLILTICCVTGIIAYAVYHKCDLLISKQVTRGEQILPYLVMDLLGDYHGLSGLFVACIYSASLSTVSSGLNSLAAVCLKDFIQPFYKMGDNKATKISKYLAATFGIITINLAYFCQYAGTTVLQVSLSIFGLLGGPLLGVISLGMFTKSANSTGALCGLIISAFINCWLGIGSVLNGKPPKLKPMSTEGCPQFTNLTNTTFIIDKTEKFDIKIVYGLSYLWYSLLSITVVFSVGLIISHLTGATDSHSLDENLFVRFDCLHTRKKDIKNIENSKGKSNEAFDDPNAYKTNSYELRDNDSYILTSF